MNNELHKKVLADLLKAGIGSEMRVIQTFKKREWHVTGSDSYYDLDNHCLREIDLVACHGILDFSNKCHSFMRVCVEVKKTENPWVVCAPRPESDRAPVMRSPFDVVPKWLAEDPSDDFHAYDCTHKLWDADYVFDLDWLGLNIHESFKSPNNKSRWQGSFYTVSKALRQKYTQSLERHNSLYSERSPDELRDTHLYSGIVVLDGPLFVATLTRDGEIELKETPYAPFDFELHTSEYEPSSHRIDVVQINSLDSYLQMMEEWHKPFNAEIKKRLKIKDANQSTHSITASGGSE